MYDTLTEKQHEIVFEKSGKFVVRACPGSGKTYCVSARLSRLINSWDKNYQGIACLSFTNVAWQEIEKKYKEVFNTNYNISYPHFLGTIDSFINKYIFLAYGHLVLKCKNRPVLVGEPHGIWTGRFFSDSFFDNLTFNIDGEIYALNPRLMPNNWNSNSQIISSKNRLIKCGYANQSDANYFAIKILEKYPQIAKSIALRFPIIIIDEAQDTSEIQMKIIDLLIANGLNEIMLVGDPDQAIFEWNDARPDLLIEKFNAWPNSIILNENRRSSQNICNYTHKISSLSEPSISVNEEIKEFHFRPKVITYTTANLREIVNLFVQECVANGIEENEQNISILYRSKGLINEITGVTEIPFNTKVWSQHSSYTKDFAKGKYLYDRGQFKNGFKLIEKAIVKIFNNLSHCREEDIENIIKKMGFINFRTAVFDFINLLPETNIAIGDWVTQVNANFVAENIEKKLQIENAGKRLTFQQLFLNEYDKTSPFNYRLGTVHSAKGETFDATLLILKSKGVGQAYKTILKNNISITDSEELRIAYVGMTRPRKILVLAVPDDTNKAAWESKFNL
ncbi:superfamily I DNA/RNA helicase [Methylobacter tundripaludum]|uniref:DNA 3'-5' helicase n=1 Tax=Methylobacter tundripaludum TaxID=173365 RepID=A0A2S6GI74_9GAMM|nr:ATP-dependent helicase [Methylobacter tundripaludum]PPK64932.1 superfamily I DNA/RNA helicase [Methylobacter tundripaludum]